jgi:hypothetical protein
MVLWFSRLAYIDWKEYVLRGEARLQLRYLQEDAAYDGDATSKNIQSGGDDPVPLEGGSSWGSSTLEGKEVPPCNSGMGWIEHGCYSREIWVADKDGMKQTYKVIEIYWHRAGDIWHSYEVIISRILYMSYVRHRRDSL